MCLALLPVNALWTVSPENIERKCQFHFEGLFSTNMVVWPLEAIKDKIQSVWVCVKCISTLIVVYKKCESIS